MDISTFRWVLIIAGALILGAIILFGNPGKRKQKRASRKSNRRIRQRQRREPRIGGAEDEKDGPDNDDDLERAENALPGQPELGLEGDTPEEPPPPLGPPPDKIVILFVQARDNHRITGVDLLDAALKSGLVFGERDIFHRVVEDTGETVFCMANLTNPGEFDKTAWNTFETNGVTLFMTLPGPMPPLDAWDALLATSRRIAEILHADLLDETRSVFTRQREGQIREELRAYAKDQSTQA